MEPEFKKKWVEALRSGEYKQTRFQLADDFQSPTEFCCLGVALKVGNRWYPTNFDAVIIDELYNSDIQLLILGISSEEIDTFVELNDTKGKSFSEIADYIEEKYGACDA